MKNILSISTAVLLLSTATAVAQEEAAGGKFSVSTGVDYSSGDYGSTTDTDMIYVPLGLKYKTDAWNVKVTVPYISIKGAGNVRPELGNVATSNATRTTESGLGDIVLAGGYTFLENIEKGFYGDITAKVKIPTADEDKNLGTGATDYTVQLDFMKTMGDFTPMFGFGYKRLGDTGTLQLDNVWLWNIGMDYKVNDSLNVGVFYDWREKATATSEHQQDGSVYANVKLNDHVKLQPYAGTGFSDGSPDLNVGLTFTYTY